MKDLKKVSFESALERLEEIVEVLSSEKTSLDQMIELYQEGMALKKFCNEKIEAAKMKIEVISKTPEAKTEQHSTHE